MQAVPLAGGGAEALGEAVGFSVRARQLVRAEQIVADGKMYLGRQHVRLKMDRDVVQGVRRDGARRNRIARPGQQRGGDQQCVAGHAVQFDAAAFDAGFHQVRQLVVGAAIGSIEMIQGGVQGVLIAAFEQLCDLACQPVFPEAVLDAAAGIAQAGGEQGDLFRFAGKAGAGAEAGAFHGVSVWRKAPILSLPPLPFGDGVSGCNKSAIRTP